MRSYNLEDQNDYFPPPARFMPIILFVIIISLVGCKGLDNSIDPIIPDSSFIFESNAERTMPDTIQKQCSKSGKNVRMYITGPAEYLTSELNPPLITENSPVFSASVSLDDETEINSTHFIAQIDGEEVRCFYDSLGGIVTFTPAYPLKEGEHKAQLLLVNDKLPLRTLSWYFKICSTPPMISFLMWSKNGEYLVVWFDRRVEPSIVMDESNWIIDEKTNNLRSEIEYNLDNMIIFLPIKNSTFERISQRVPVKILFRDKNGTTDYYTNRLGSSREAETYDPCYEGDPPTVVFFPDHHVKETEDYVFGYETTRSDCMIVEFKDWSFTPIKNDNPELNYDQDVDNSTSGPYPSPEPLEYLAFININQDDKTSVAAPRSFTHDFTLEFWADRSEADRYDPGNPNPSEYETMIAAKNYSFHSGFDTSPPEFLLEPEILYGDQTSQKVQTIVGNLPWCDDLSGTGDKCCSLNQSTLELMYFEWESRKCDLFLVTHVIDPAPQGRNNSFFQQTFCLDIKYDDDHIEYWCDNYDMATDITIDYKPWANVATGSDVEHEDDPWPDQGWPSTLLVEDQGSKYIIEDISGSESFVKVWDLSSILSSPEGQHITSIRVRVTDASSDPYPGYHGNWRRSGNVMEQLCNQLGESERSGSEVFWQYPCDHTLQVEFVGVNSHDHSDTKNQYKIVDFEADCDARQTNYIHYMTSIPDKPWGSKVKLAARLVLDGGEKKDPNCENPDQIKIRVLNSEETPGPYDFADVTLTRYDKYYSIHHTSPYKGDKTIFLTDLYYLFGLTSNRGDPVPENLRYCQCEFYVGELFVSDDITVSDPRVSEQIYVSNSDHKLLPSQQKDFAITMHQTNCTPEIYNCLNFGTSRGIGCYETDINKNQWYSFDDFIKSGGFEIIKVFKAYQDDPKNPNPQEPDQNNLWFNITKSHGSRLSAVPIQSEADVLIAISHGSSKIPQLGPYFSFPTHSDMWLDRECDKCSDFTYEGEWEGRCNVFTFNHDCNYGYSCAQSQVPPCSDCYNRDDFIESYGTNPAPAKFWKQQGRDKFDTKWLVALSCYTLSNMNNQGLVLQNRVKIADLLSAGYFDSICGFKSTISDAPLDIPIYGKDSFYQALLTKYNYKMSILSQTNPCPDESYLWQPEDSYTPDPSTAAFLETCALLSRSPDLRTVETNVHKACSLAKIGENVYSWHIKLLDEYDYRFQVGPNNYITLHCDGGWRIVRRSLNVNEANI